MNKHGIRFILFSLLTFVTVVSPSSAAILEHLETTSKQTQPGFDDFFVALHPKLPLEIDESTTLVSMGVKDTEVTYWLTIDDFYDENTESERHDSLNGIFKEHGYCLADSTFNLSMVPVVLNLLFSPTGETTKHKETLNYLCGKN